MAGEQARASCIRGHVPVIDSHNRVFVYSDQQSGVKHPASKMSSLAAGAIAERAREVALGIETREHCALCAMLTVSQLSKCFAGRALFGDVSLQVNRGDLIKFQSLIH